MGQYGTAWLNRQREDDSFVVLNKPGKWSSWGNWRRARLVTGVSCARCRRTRPLLKA